MSISKRLRFEILKRESLEVLTRGDGDDCEGDQ